MAVADSYSLLGKAAFVTGTGSGIGRAIAVGFASAGAQVACLDLVGDTVAATSAEAAKRGHRSIAVVCDVGSDDVKIAAGKLLGGVQGPSMFSSAARPGTIQAELCWT